jgi:hypothetical protein
MDHTCETIEAIPRADIPEVRRLACELHEATTGILDTPLHPQQLEEQESLRTAINLKLSESINDLDARIADMKALKNDLRILKGYTASDKERIKSAKIAAYIQLKEQRITAN